MLGGLHDAYRAMLIETGEERLLAARTLLVLAGDGGGRVFAAHLARAGVKADVDRLSSVLTEARDLARDVLSGGIPPPGVGRHSANTDWLGSLYLSTGCGGGGLAPDGRLAAPDLGGREGATASPAGAGERIVGLALLAGGVLAGAAVAAVAAWRIGRTFFWRSRKVERQPRASVALDLDVSFSDGTPPNWMRVRALDVSVGGMKLAWEGAPPVGSAVTLKLPFGERAGTVMWANAFYAGVMFADFLAEDELGRLIE